MLLAAIGVVRMPDAFTRMQATTKASTLGLGCMLAAVAIHFGNLSAFSRAAAIVMFVFLTTPVAAHVIARAAYFMGLPLWEGTIRDELSHQYDRATGILRSPPIHGTPDTSAESPDSKPESQP